MSRHATLSRLLPVVKDLTRQYWPIVGTVILWAILFFFLARANFLRVENGEWYTSSFAWGDLPWHLAIITGMVERGWDAIGQNPIFAGIPLKYPFIYDAVTAGFVYTGLSLRASLILTTVPLLALLTILISVTSYRFTGSVIGAASAPWLYYLFSSPDAYRQIGIEITRQGGSWINTLLRPVTNFTHGPETGIYATSPISDCIIPQRPIILGFIMGLLVINFVFSFLRSDKRRYLLWGGVPLGLLPLLHMHTFLSLVILLGCSSLVDILQTKKEKRERLKNWILFWCITAVLALPQILFLHPPTQEFLRWQPGWVIRDQSWMLFWIKNLGLYIMLFPYCAWKSGKRVRTILLPAYILFIIIHFIVFQPYEWDNTKLLQWFLLVQILAVPLALRDIGRLLPWRWSRRIVSGCLFLFLIIPGISCFAYGMRSDRRLFSASDLQLATFVREHTPRDALFLTSYRHDNPVVSVAGRQILAGFGTWLWSHGIQSKEREEHVKMMYRGDAQAPSLLRQYGVDYVLIEQEAIEGLTMNEDFFRQQGKMVYSSPQVRLYTLTRK